MTSTQEPAHRTHRTLDLAVKTLYLIRLSGIITILVAYITIKFLIESISPTYLVTILWQWDCLALMGYFVVLNYWLYSRTSGLGMEITSVKNGVWKALLLR